MYGENTSLLRQSLRELLTQHRIQHRIGAAGPVTGPATTTPEERRQIGALIARYRHSVLTRCHQGMYAARPHIDLDGLTKRTRGPAEELRHRLGISLSGDTAGLPTLHELTTEQPFPMVELWRHAARACALGEHDFGAGLGHGRLPKAQTLTLIHDTAEITRALLALDRRYVNIPGWRPIKDAGYLTRAAEVCAAYFRRSDLDYSIDHHGWKPPAQLIDGPGLPGITGVLQAQHNLLLHLATLPDAHSLRVIIDSQRLVSLHTARRLTDADPEAAAPWEHRTEVYGRLVRQTRDLAGMIGNGGLAAGQGAIAASRAQHLHQDAIADPAHAARLERLSAGIDQRVSHALRHGITNSLYLQRINVPGLDERDGTLVHVTRQRCIPVTGRLRDELLRIARDELRPVPTQRQSPESAAQNRLDFRAAIDHRPRNRGRPMAL